MCKSSMSLATQVAGVLSCRRYLPLRAEVNKFIKLVSKLNSAAVDGLPEEIGRTRSAMRESIERMVAAASKTE